MSVELLDAPPPGGFDLVVGGDVVLRGAAAGRLDTPLAALLREATTVVNLEAPLVARPAPVVKAGPHLALPVAAVGELRALGIDAVGLANNHLGDHGADGVRSTLEACAGAGLAAAGAGEDAAAALRPATLTVAGARVALLALAEAEFGLATEDAPGVAAVSSTAAPAAIAAARAEHDVVVVLAHGGVEELPVSPPQRAAQLRALLDAGADLVVGSHPHTAQGWEERSGGVAFHALGDLLFDAEGGGPSAPGALVGVTLEGRGVARVSVLAVARGEDGVVGLAASEPLRGLSGLIGDEPLWQELAARVFADRYLPLLRDIGVPAPPAPTGPPGIRTARDLAARLRPGAASPRAPADWEALQLLNVLRCESQRWTVETALALAGGLVADLRTRETRERADELLRGAGYPGAT